MFKKLFGVILMFGLIAESSAQEVNKKNFNLDFYGFVRNEIFVDTYKGIDAAYELFYLVPYYTGQDDNGKDFNQQTSSNLSAIASRLGVKVNGPEIFGATTSATLEFDFVGIVKTEPTLFRIRHASMSFNWEKSKLLIGQTWHPFWGGGCYPTVGSLNTGAPFQAFSRAPQIRYDVKTGTVTFTGAVVYENQYTSKVMESSVFTTPTQAQRNGAMPEFVVAAEYNKNGLTFGAGAEVKRIKPRMTVTGTDGKFNAEEYLTSSGFMTYLKYKSGMFKMTAKGYYGQNMTHLCFLGGYGVATRNTATGEETYTNYNNFTSLLNLVYGKKWQGGLFLGYGDNLGTSDPLHDNGSGKAITAGLFPNIQDFYRISPHIALNVSKLRLVAEYEMTTANYGVGGFNFNDGLFAGTHQATNNRIILMMTYLF
ncbi:hypothetical protein ACUNWD_09115 [Sunxiuqinia sp. A32]|uniref:hypothetical protein n=1 Tax=Sunxiuqinia sp. A32 TaxID=3461496 RepID=UPI004046724C